MSKRVLSVLIFVLLFSLFLEKPSQAQSKPNVILVMTDDQGYGDLACHGNPVLKTPALDTLYAQSLRLTNYHVDPTCSPTRSALMTGRYSTRTGVWHTIMGRSLLHPDEVTMADVFAANGYKTGIFGKWHLGDNYPCRPQDNGFQEVLVHGGGGVGQTPDYFGNDYFDDTYLHNGVPKKFEGYCTDIWFDNALKFIEKNRQRPFFAYIPTNAAHGPFHVAEKYSKPYEEAGVPRRRAKFYGMIANIDENMAKLERKLKEWNLRENTIVIFTTDNGTAGGMMGPNGYNAGMRGIKGSEYDGGHRVPFFVRWPAGNLGGGKDITRITAHIDVLPTLIDLCNLTEPKHSSFDGTSLKKLLQNPKANWPKRTLLVHSQRIEKPKKGRKAAVMTDRWRMVITQGRRQLFDMQADPGQKNDIADQHPIRFRELARAYDSWYQNTSERHDGYVRISLGSPQENPARLTCHDWHEPVKGVPWAHGHIRNMLVTNGFWAVKIERAGRYRFTLRQRPEYKNFVLQAKNAKLKIGSVELATKIPEGAKSVSFEVELHPGNAKLKTWLDDLENKSRGAYFVDVTYLGNSR